MAKMIQLRHVPDALKGLSLSDYLVLEVSRIAEQPTVEEALDRIAHRSRVTPGISSAEIIRQQRDSL